MMPTSSIAMSTISSVTGLKKEMSSSSVLPPPSGYCAAGTVHCVLRLPGCRSDTACNVSVHLVPPAMQPVDGAPTDDEGNADFLKVLARDVPTAAEVEHVECNWEAQAWVNE